MADKGKEGGEKGEKVEGEVEKKVEGSSMKKKTVEMFDLLLQKGTKIKAFSKQDEERRRAQQKLKKLGIDSVEQLDEQLLSRPGLEDDLTPKRTKARNSNSSKSSGDDNSSQDEDLLE